MTHDPLNVPALKKSSIIDADYRVRARIVALRLGISVRTLDRWLQRPELDFPRPVMVTHDVAGRVAARFWRVGDLIEWQQRQQTFTAQKRGVELSRT